METLNYRQSEQKALISHLFLVTLHVYSVRMLFKRYIVFLLLAITLPQSVFSKIKSNKVKTMPADSIEIEITDTIQTEKSDSTKIEKAIAKIDKLTAGEALKAWHVTEASAIEMPTIPDTLHLNYQTATTPVYQKYIAAEWLGNLGLPAQSAIFAERPTTMLAGDNIFLRPYIPYYLGVENVYFYNTRVPYTNVSYYTGGLFTQHAEDRVNGLFSINANKRLNFGLCFDLLYGRGMYYNQSSTDVNGAFNLSYRGEKYSLYFIAGLNNFKNYENGGIKNDGDLKNMTDSYILQTNLNNAYSTFRSYYLWMDNQYHLGYDEIDPDDSEKKTFVPVTTLSYAIKYEGKHKRYYERSITEGFYANNFYSDKCTRDTVATNFIRNVLSITFNEGFKPWAVFSLRAFAEADWEENMRLIADSTYAWKSEGKVSVGGELFKRKGNTTFGVLGEALILGSNKRFAFNVNGDFNTIIPLNTCSLTINAEGHIKSTNPSYFHEHYYSNHFIWENNFNNEWNARGYGKIGIPNKWVDFEVGAGWQGLKEHIYFDTLAMPQQCHDFIQIVSGEAKVNLHLWWFHWENKAVVQYSSNKDVLPLPLVSLYSNFYASFAIWKKILKIQMGVDCRYNTEYYANAYMPATGQFYLQNKTLVGNYPELNVYVNLHLKRFRFFVMWYNFSTLFMDKFFTTPHHPLNPTSLKLGLSWNFYN